MSANEEMVERVSGVIERQINPRLKWEGGRVELVSVDEGTVRVRLIGACASCPLRQFTLINFVESTIKAGVPEVKEVVAVS